MIYIYRFAEENLRNLLKDKEIIAVTGPRQAGKTTLIQHVLKSIPNSISYSFDDIKMVNEFSADPEFFYEKYMKGFNVVFLDEIQYVPESGRLLKQIYDSKKIKIIVSGSSAPEISIQTLKHLVGRVFMMEVLPLSLHEYINYKNERLYKILKDDPKNILLKNDCQKYVLEYMTYGGYPRVILEENHEGKIKVLSNIHNTLLLREIRDIAGIADSNKIHKLLKALSLNQGSLVEYKTLTKASGYSFDTLKKYLNILEKCYVVFYALPFFTNKLKEMVKSPKIYFFDLGLRNYILEDFRESSLRLDKGALLEGLAANIFKEMDKTLNFWRDKKGHEVDFVKILPENKINIYEIKWSHEFIDKETTESINKLYKINSTKIISFEPDFEKDKSVPIWVVKKSEFSL